MTKLKRVFTLSFFVFLLSAPLLSALEIPKRPSGYVTDQADLLSPQTEAKLESLLNYFDIQTTNQIVLVTFNSLEGEALEDFAIRLAEAWKVGQKGKDNGVIFLIFKNDRKMRIEVGYGLEGAIPDALAGQIIAQIVTPQFKQGNYEQGIINGLGAIMKAAQGEFKGVSRSAYGSRSYQRELTPEEMEALRRQSARFAILIGIFFGFLFFVDIFRFFGYRKNHRIYKDRYSFWEWFFRFAIMLAVISFLFRMLFYMALFSRGGYYGSRGGGGGFSGGGGSFGGGGASGSW